MFVRIEGRRIETCPIAGTRARTGDPLRDADNILTSQLDQEESELTMCSDVDRNDKSRVCEPAASASSPPPDRILRRSLPTPSTMSKALSPPASIRSMRLASPICCGVIHDGERPTEMGEKPSSESKPGRECLRLVDRCGRLRRRIRSGGGRMTRTLPGSRREICRYGRRRCTW